MTSTPLEYSDYVVYVDESGDHSLGNINPYYPVFVLSFCIFRKEYYSHIVTPALRMLKFLTFGHDMVVLHEHEIRKKAGLFKLLSKEPRELFFEKLSNLIAQTDFVLIPIVIDKYAIKKGTLDLSSMHIYHLAMRLGLEQLYQFLQLEQQETRLTHVIFEARGRTEDLALELEFQRVCKGNNSFQATLPFDIVVADKKTNSEGLQFADMVARPSGLSVLRSGQPNRALKILEKKFFQKAKSKTGTPGPFVFPLESERPQGFPWSLTPVG